MDKTKASKEYLQGIPELLILRLLQSREMYGYEIVQSIKLETRGAIEFREGVIYPLLHSLHSKRLLAIRRAKVRGRERVYYRLTKAGLKRLNSKVADWNMVVDAVRGVLHGESAGDAHAAP